MRETAPKLCEAQIWKDWCLLCEEIGERGAGSAAEGKATSFIGAQFSSLGLKSVEIEEFPCLSLVKARSSVEAWCGGGWQHHSVHDTLENVSAAPVVRLAAGLLPLLRDLSTRSAWPFRRTFPVVQQRAVRRLWDERFTGSP
jgi:hypothetical protein